MFNQQRYQNSQNNNNNNNQRSYQTVNVNRPFQSSSSGQPSMSEKIEKVAIQIFPAYRLKSFTAANMIAIYAMYIICWIYYYATSNNWRCTTHFFGSHYGPDIGQEYQLHRLITPIWLHHTNMHIFFNSLGLCFFGFELERYYGMTKFAIMYIGAAIGGNLFSTLYHYDTFAMGASTSLSGVIALQCLYLYERKEELGERFKRVALQLGFIIGINVIQSITEEKIDGAGHLGGFVFGLLIGLLYMKNDWFTQRRYLKVLIILILVISSGVLFYLIFTHENGKQNKEPTFSEMANNEQLYIMTDEGRENVGYCSKKLEQQSKKWEEEEQIKKYKKL